MPRAIRISVIDNHVTATQAVYIGIVTRTPGAVALTTLEGIVTVTSEQGIMTLATDEIIIPGIAGQAVITLTALQAVTTRSTVEIVISPTAEKSIVTRFTHQSVMPVKAIEGIGAGIAMDDVISIATQQCPIQNCLGIPACTVLESNHIEGVCPPILFEEKAGDCNDLTTTSQGQMQIVVATTDFDIARLDTTSKEELVVSPLASVMIVDNRFAVSWLELIGIIAGTAIKDIPVTCVTP
jgi:hypothetical protein